MAVCIDDLRWPMPMILGDVLSDLRPKAIEPPRRPGPMMAICFKSFIFNVLSRLFGSTTVLVRITCVGQSVHFFLELSGS